MDHFDYGNYKLSLLSELILFNYKDLFNTKDFNLINLNLTKISFTVS